MTMTAYRAWLPQAAIESRAVEEMLATLVSDWSRKWFGRRPMRLDGGAGPAGTAAGSDENQWHVLEEGLAVGTCARARATLARALLDLEEAEQLSTPADKAVAELLAGSCLEDLRARLGHLLRLGADCVWRAEDAALRPQLACGREYRAVATAGEAPIRIVLDDELFVTLIKQGVRAVPDTIALRPVAEGLALQAVQLSAAVGACELPLAEIADLAPGDVLVLDSESGSPFELAVDGECRSGRCTLAEHAGGIALKLTQPFFE
ncbi:MAG: FliM/FliN family flagellar motor C-terminal domain-containing protein [Pseudomonadota bacterium]|nr:FliM/FliN family flagellar motor C-terminal domain-containing protein [Pseudomonadota bacterium]